MIRPIVIYPFRSPDTNEHLNALYLFLYEIVRKGGGKYAQPITVINRQTHYKNSQAETFLEMRKAIGSYDWQIVDAWCVDTCQMWLAGFGAAHDLADAAGHFDDVYWLIPGDFRYATPVGKDVLTSLPAIAETIATKPEIDLCIGQIRMHPNSSKHLIDTYGTYGLLFNWFPAEAAQIRGAGIDRPRSEFFAIHHRLLRNALVEHRWFAYEQTIALLLQARDYQMRAIPLGDISDPSEARDNLTGALQQIERTERVLKVAWRDRQKRRAHDWVHEFRALEEQSRQIIGAAMTVLANSL